MFRRAVFLIACVGLVLAIAGNCLSAEFGRDAALPRDPSTFVLLVIPDSPAAESDLATQRALAILSDGKRTPESPLFRWVSGANVAVKAASDSRTKQSHGAFYTPQELPTLFVQRADGAVIYKASRQSFPADHYTLGREIDYYASLAPYTIRRGRLPDAREHHGPIDWVEQCPDDGRYPNDGYQPDCPDGICPTVPGGNAPYAIPDSRLIVGGPLSAPQPLVWILAIAAAAGAAIAIAKRQPPGSGV